MRHRQPVRVIAVLVAAAQLAWWVPAPALVSTAHAQPITMSQPVRQGWEFWRDGKYLESIARLERALQDPALAPRDRVQSLAIIGQCHVRLGDRESAIASFHGVLDVEREWRPSADVFEPDEMETFSEALRTWTPPKPPARSWWKNPWVIGGGVLTVGGIIAAASGSGQDGTTTPDLTLPAPPDPPGN